MYSNRKMGGPLRWILCYSMWIVLSLLVGLVAWTMCTTVLYLTTLLVNSPTLRPWGWSMGSVGLVGRLAIFVLGSGWLIVSMWLEGALRGKMLDGRFWPFVGRVMLIAAVVYLVCYGILTVPT